MKKTSRNNKYLKGFTAAALGLTLVSGSAAGAMAATGPTLGPAPTASQAAAAQAAAPYETITGVTETANGLNIDVSMSNVATGLPVSTLSDDGAGHYKAEVDATGITAGTWTNAVGQAFISSFKGIPATITVTGFNANNVSLDISLASVPTPNVTPTFTASGSSMGPAPVAQKGSPTVVDDNEVLDTTKQAGATYDPLSKDTPSQGYIFDPASLKFIDAMSGAAIPTQNTPGATFSIVNGKVQATSIQGWSGFANLAYTATEKWAEAGGEPAGWAPATITGKLKVQIIGAQPVQSAPNDCTVPVAPAGGSGFSISAPMAAVGGGALTCNLVAVADNVSIPGDASQATVNAGAQDVPTNASYKVDPESIQYRSADGNGFATDVVYPNQFELSYDSKTGITTAKRIGTYSGKIDVLRRVSEYKLDSNGNKVMGGSSSALLTINVAPLDAATTPETPAPVVPAPVVPETPVAVTDNTPAPAPVGDTEKRPFKNLGDTSAAPASKAASVAPTGNDNSGIIAAELALIALTAAGALVVKARHRKVQVSDIAA